MTEKRTNRMAAVFVAAIIGLGMTLPGVASARVNEALNDRMSVRSDTEGRGVGRSIVESVTAPGGAALEVSIRRRNQEAWRSRVTVPLSRDIQAGDTVEVRVWVRAESPLNSLGTGNVDLQIVRTREPYDNIFSENIRPTSEGQYYTVRGVANSDFDAEDVVFGANLGYGRQTIQFGPIFVTRIDPEE